MIAPWRRQLANESITCACQLQSYQQRPSWRAGKKIFKKEIETILFIT
jgi:hypothetical protein